MSAAIDYYVRIVSSYQTQVISYPDQFFLAHLPSFFTSTKGGCTGFVKYLATETIDRFCHRAMEQAGILLLPGTVYGVASNHFRLGFGRSNMPEALAALEKFLKREDRSA